MLKEYNMEMIFFLFILFFGNDFIKRRLISASADSRLLLAQNIYMPQWNILGWSTLIPYTARACMHTHTHTHTHLAHICACVYTWAKCQNEFSQRLVSTKICLKNSPK